MGTDLISLEKEIAPLAPHFEQALAGVMPVDRLIRTALISVERNPYLLECNRQSFFNTIMTAGVLGLEMDGVTGQAFPIPFKGKVQLVIGYKGYNTLGARAGLTITGDAVREGDEFDYEKGTNPFLKFKEGKSRGRVTHAWSVAAAHGRPPIIEVLSIDDLLAIKDKSPGARKPDSPWNNPEIGFPAMCAKSAKRRLCRSTPLNVRMQLAARMEEAFEEQGHHSFITPDQRLVIEGDSSPIAERERNETPTAEQLIEPLKKDDGLQYLRDDGAVAAGEGLHSLSIWFGDLPKPLKFQMKAHLDGTLKATALKVDVANTKMIEPGPLEALNARIREVLANDPKLLGEWNAAYLERKLEIAKLQTAAE